MSISKIDPMNTASSHLRGRGLGQEQGDNAQGQHQNRQPDLGNAEVLLVVRT